MLEKAKRRSSSAICSAVIVFGRLPRKSSHSVVTHWSLRTRSSEPVFAKASAAARVRSNRAEEGTTMFAGTRGWWIHSSIFSADQAAVSPCEEVLLQELPRTSAVVTLWKRWESNQRRRKASKRARPKCRSSMRRKFAPLS